MNTPSGNNVCSIILTNLLPCPKRILPPYVRNCWQVLARQLGLFFIIARRRHHLSDVRLKTCAVDCVSPESLSMHVEILIDLEQ